MGQGEKAGARSETAGGGWCSIVRYGGEPGGISFSGKTLNVTGDAQVRLRLACQPCNCYLLPVNGFQQSLPCVKGGSIFARK